MRASTVPLIPLLCALAVAGSACSRKAPSATTQQTPASSAAAPPAAVPAAPPAQAQAPAPTAPLAFRGKVEKVDGADGMLTVNAEDVPGWGMPPMTMSYHVSNPAVLQTVKAGDEVAAKVYKGDFAKLYDVSVVAEAVAEKSELPPLSYVCPTRGEENEISDKPGACTSSPAKLVPVRLTIAYECLKGPAFIQATPGVCRYDKSDLAPITASMFWTCGSDNTESRYLEPGKCADGSTRREHFEKRPHGDHNPRHGGPYVAMSADLMHHSEGTLVAPGVFRAYFYDEYTRPMPVAGYTARIVPTDSNAREVGSPIALTADRSRGINVMEAHVPNAPTPTSTAPLHFKLHVSVTRDAKDWTSDWDFTHYSTEPGIPPAPGTMTASASAPTAPAGASPSPAAAPAPSAAAAPPAGSAASPAASANAAGGSTAMGGGAELSSAGPPPQEPLPATTAGLLAEMQTHITSIDALLNDGNLGGLWLDALRTKDLAIALNQKHASDLPEAERPKLASAVKDLTESAWQIDAAGDLGQRERIDQLHQVFAGAASEIESLYGSSHQ